jgi:hypothetical protein
MNDAIDDQGNFRNQSAFGWRWAIAIFLMTLLAINFSVVLGIRTARFDAFCYFYPYYTLVADSARNGEVLLWTPLLVGGCPAGLEPQVGAASPLQVLLGLLTGGNNFGFRLYWLTIWSLGGLGILALACHLRIPPPIACIGAIGYAFSAIYTGHAQHTSYLVSMSLFPWALWRLDVAITQRSWWAAVQAGAIWGLSALGGYPGLLLAGAGYAVVWVFGRLFLSDEAVPVVASVMPKSSDVLRRLGFHTGVLAVFGLTGLAVLSPTYVGFLTESPGYTCRSEPVVRVARRAALPVKGVTTFSSPYLCIWNTASGYRAWVSDASLSSIYVTPVLLVLALTWQTPGGNSRFRWFLRVTAVFFILMAAGNATPLYGWFYDLVPPLRFVRFAALFRCYYVLTVVILGMLAFRESQQLVSGRIAEVFWKNASRVALLIMLLAFVAFAVVARILIGNERLHPEICWSIVVMVGTWLSLTLLLMVGQRGSPAVRRHILCYSLLVLTIVDAAFTARFCRSGMYEYVDAANYAETMHVCSLDLTSQGWNRQLSTDAMKLPWNGNFLTKVPVLTGYTAMFDRIQQKSATHPILGPTAMGPDRIWFSPTALETPRSKDCFERFVTAVERSGHSGLVLCGHPEGFGAPPKTVPPDQLAELGEKMDRLPPMERIATQLIEYTPNRLVFEVNPPREGWLLVTDRWAPGWHATINGVDASIWIGNFLFRAVHVDKGSNCVAFTYCPIGHPWLLLLSWGTLGVVLVLSIRSRWRPLLRSSPKRIANG